MDDCYAFREELALRYPTLGHALWEPDPGGLYDSVEVGDVGFIREGYFCRLFNALRPSVHPPDTSSSHAPNYPPQLELTTPDHIRRSIDNRSDFSSKYISKTTVPHEDNIYATGPDGYEHVSFSCSGKQGAWISLPFLAQREDTLARADFGKWLIKNIHECMKVADDLGWGVSCMEDIILVTGRHLARSWTNGTFTESRRAQVSFGVRVSGVASVNLQKRDVNGGDLKLGPCGEHLPENQCIFVRGYRVVRLWNIWPRLRAMAGPTDDMHEPEPQSDTPLEVIGVPANVDHRDPLHVLLAYLADQAPECDIALVHDDDLECVDGAPLETLEPEVLLRYLCENAPPVQEVQCRYLPGNRSVTGAVMTRTTVATLSKDLVQGLHESWAIPFTNTSSDEASNLSDDLFSEDDSSTIPTTVYSLPTGSQTSATQHWLMTMVCEAIRDDWIDMEGEILVLSKDDALSLTPNRYGLLAIKDPDGGDSWIEGHAALYDNCFVFFKRGETVTKANKSSHLIRPIPLELLRLASSNDEPEVRKQDQPIVPRFGSPRPPKSMYPFTIYHASARMTRRVTLYTESGTDRNRWRNALKEAAEARKAKQRDNLLYTLRTLDEKSFHVPPYIAALSRGRHFTGKALCTAEFPHRGERYLAVGCNNGIYLRDRSSNSPFQIVLESDNPTSIAAVPESDAFLVHCESKLFSYRLGHIISVSQGDTGLKNIDGWETRLAEGHGDVLFFKAGRIGGQTLIVYSAKKSEQVTSHISKLTCPDGVPQYKPLGSPMSTPGDPQNVAFLTTEVAICTSKAIYFVKPTENTFHTVVPELPNSERNTNAIRRALKGVQSLIGTRKKNNPLKVLGLVKCGNENLIVYDRLGYFMNEAGKPDRPTYHASWECMANAFARQGSHLLLFSPGFIEVRDADTGKFIQVIEKHDVRYLRCGWAEHDVLIAATAGDAAKDGSRNENLVELIKHGI